MLTSYVVGSEFEKRRRFCQISSKSHALEAFWRGLEELRRGPGGGFGGLGRFREGCLSPDADLQKNMRILTPSWAPCWARKMCFLMLKIRKCGSKRRCEKSTILE